MAAPQVRTLDQLSNLYNTVYQPQIQQEQAGIASANSRLAEQTAGLDAAKTNAFGDITQAAASRGATFSGFTPNAQAKYIGEKYLPALADLRTANEQTIQGINKNIAQLQAEQRTRAIDTREQDLAKLYDYQKTQQQHVWETQAADLAYKREMAKLQQQQKFEASQNAANRASSGTSETERYRGDAAAVAANLASKTGSDGYVSPTTWAQQKAAFIQQGWTAQQFDQAFAGYKNPKNPYYK